MQLTSSTWGRPYPSRGGHSPFLRHRHFTFLTPASPCGRVTFPQLYWLSPFPIKALLQAMALSFYEHCTRQVSPLRWCMHGMSVVFSFTWGFLNSYTHRMRCWGSLPLLNKIELCGHSTTSPSRETRHQTLVRAR